MADRGEHSGRLDVEVAANLRGFARHLRREVNEAARKVTAKITPQVSAPKLRAELRRAAREATSSVKVSVTAGVRITATELRRAVREASNKAKPTAKIGVRIGVADFRRAVREVAAKAKAVAKIGVRITAADLRRALRDAEARARLRVRVDVDPGPARRTIAGLTRRQPRLGLDIKDFLGKARKAAGAVAGIAAMTAKASVFAVLAAGAAAATGSLIGFVGALAPALQAIGVLPAMAGAAVGVLATLIVAFEGVGGALSQTWDAFSTLAAGEKLTAAQQEKLADSLENLAPSARKFVLQIGKLAPALRDLRLDVQDRFFKGLDKSVGKLAATHLPALRSGLATVSSEINSGLRAALARLDDKASASALKLMLAESGRAAKNLFAALGPILQILLDVGSVGATLLPNLTGGLKETTERWAGMVRAAAKSGALRDWIKDGLSMLGELGKIAKNVGGILKGIFGAAGEASGGAGSVTILGELLATLNEVVNSTGGRQALVEFFTALGQVGSALSPILVAVVGGLGPLATIIGDFATALSPGLTVLVAALADGLRNLAPAAKPVGEALGAVAKALAPLLPLIGASLANALIATAGVLQGVAVEAGPVLGVFAEMATEIAKALLPVLKELIAGGLGPATAAGLALAKAFAPLVPVVVELVKVIAGKLMEHLPELQRMIGDKLVPAVVKIADAFAGALLDALLKIAPHLPDLIDAGLELALALTELALAVTPMLPDLVKLAVIAAALATSFAKLIPMITGMVKSATGSLKAWKELASRAKEAGQAVRGFLSDTWDKIKNVGKSIGEFFTTKLPGWIDSATKWFEELPGRIGDALSELPGKLAEWAQAALEKAAYWWGYGLGLILGYLHDLPKNIEEKWNAITAAVGAGVDAVIDWFKQLPERAGAIWDELWDKSTEKTSSGVEAVVEWFRGLPDRLGGAVSDARDRVVAAFEAMWTRAKEAVTNGITKVSDLVKSIPQKLGDLKSLLLQAGKDLIVGFAEGIAKAAPIAIDAAKGVVKSAITGVKDALESRSPSKVAIRIGKDFVAGYGIGLSDARPAQKAAARLARSTVGPFNAATPAGRTAAGRDLVGAAGAPLIGQVTLQGAQGSFSAQLEELMFQLRVIRRGGVVAGG